MEHKLKTLSKYFQDIRSGRKNFEVRYNDRNFQVGDVLILEEISDECQYTEQVERRTINYILNNSLYCKEGYVILGLKFDKQESQGWIKCSDRLPEEPSTETQEYIITDNKGAVTVAMFIHKDITAANVRWYKGLRPLGMNEVVAWMPLPTPLKEGGEFERRMYK